MSKETENTTWPLPKFYFTVDFGAAITKIPFQEITGLETDGQMIKYKSGNSAVYAPIKMPGLAKNGHVMMKKGLFPSTNIFLDWHNQIMMNTMPRTTITVKLLDETSATAMEWQLNNALPTKIVSTNLGMEGNEIAVESIEVAFETMVISAP
jgi:phage tail-like protein